MGQNILIVGAGIIGAALAFRLARLGTKVTVIEAGKVANAASGRSFGWINASFYQSTAHFQLRLAAMAAHRRLALGLPGSGHLWQGCIWFEEQGQALVDMHKALNDLHYPLRVLSRGEVQAMEPALANAPDQALLFPSEGAVDAAALSRRLLDAAKELGTNLHLGLGAKSLIEKAGRIVGVRTAIEPIWADHVVLAAGVGTPALLHDIGVALPMLTRPGLILRTNPVAWRLNHILVTPDHEIRQDGAGCLLAPAASNHQGDSAQSVPDPEGEAEATLAHLRQRFNAPDITMENAVIGLRPVPADGLPVIGLARPGLSLAVMHSGVTLAALAAEELADEVLELAQSPLLAAFRPTRFQR